MPVDNPQKAHGNKLDQSKTKFLDVVKGDEGLRSNLNDQLSYTKPETNESQLNSKETKRTLMEAAFATITTDHNKLPKLDSIPAPNAPDISNTTSSSSWTSFAQKAFHSIPSGSRSLEHVSRSTTDSNIDSGEIPTIDAISSSSTENSTLRMLEEKKEAIKAKLQDDIAKIKELLPDDFVQKHGFQREDILNIYKPEKKVQAYNQTSEVKDHRSLMNNAEKKQYKTAFTMATELKGKIATELASMKVAQQYPKDQYTILRDIQIKENNEERLQIKGDCDILVIDNNKTVQLYAEVKASTHLLKGAKNS